MKKSFFRRILVRECPVWGILFACVCIVCLTGRAAAEPSVGTSSSHTGSQAASSVGEQEKEGLFSTIEKGIFGGVKRPFDGGHGLEGVCTKGENYFNPFIELFMDHE